MILKWCSSQKDAKIKNNNTLCASKWESKMLPFINNSCKKVKAESDQASWSNFLKNAWGRKQGYWNDIYACG